MSSTLHSRTNSQPTKLSGRLGFTLVELLVVITIIGMLVALLLPAVNAARSRASQAECASNLKQVTTGIINYESSKQRYPGFIEPIPIKIAGATEYLAIDTSGGITESRMVNTMTTVRDDASTSWAAAILPYIDQTAIHDNMTSGEVVTSGDDRTRIKQIESYICPADTELSAQQDNAGLTWVMNTGAWDYDSSGNYVGDVKANGIGHNRARGSVKLNMSSLNKDGASNTLLLSENIHKEIEGSTYTWAGVAVGVVPEQYFGMVWVMSDAPQSQTGPLLFQQGLSNEGDVSGYVSTTPAFARPASAHPGGVFNCAFADGHAAAINPDIDYTVYQRLLTTDGKKCVDPTGVVDTKTLFQNLPPLAASDY